MRKIFTFLVILVVGIGSAFAYPKHSLKCRDYGVSKYHICYGTLFMVGIPQFGPFYVRGCYYNYKAIYECNICNNVASVYSN